MWMQANQMTVSITGATGFIGRRLVQRLHAGFLHLAIIIYNKKILFNVIVIIFCNHN